VKAALIILAALLALLHPWAVLGCVLAVLAVLAWLIRRTARAFPFLAVLPWRPA
jgi:hypothetical protein